jgi:hypothetical protein
MRLFIPVLILSCYVLRAHCCLRLLESFVFHRHLPLQTKCMQHHVDDRATVLRRIYSEAMLNRHDNVIPLSPF